jgi:hypothetical protein
MLGMENLVFAAFTTISVVLLTVSVLAYRRSRSRKMLVLSGVFLLFLIKGTLISLALFTEVMGLYELIVVGSGIDTLALLTLYLSTMRV